ncbi:MAG TPA: hypothetical protein VGP68_08695, partial [Gemmataceae bacterium]|nr:hypothetical protein [Gemmataceae bacterium]
MSLRIFFSLCLFGASPHIGSPAPLLAQPQPETIRAAHMLDGRGNERENVKVTIHQGLITRVENAAAGTPATYQFDKL